MHNRISIVDCLEQSSHKCGIIVVLALLQGFTNILIEMAVSGRLVLASFTSTRNPTGFPIYKTFTVLLLASGAFASTSL